MSKPEGLPQISDVVLDKVQYNTLSPAGLEEPLHGPFENIYIFLQIDHFIYQLFCLSLCLSFFLFCPCSVILSLQANKAPLRQLDPSRLPGMNMGPDFTPSFANLGRPGMGGGGGGHRGGPVSYHEKLSIFSDYTQILKLWDYI